jgi:hypothetical protein
MPDITATAMMRKSAVIMGVSMTPIRASDEYFLKYL